MTLQPDSDNMTKTVDLVINSGRLVYTDRIAEQSLAIDQGKIVAIGPASQMPPSRQSVDATGLHVLPGAIDVHVHFREPGFSHKETWTTATQAAAVGGVTTVFDMPNTNPPTASVAAFLQKHDIAQRQAIVDFGLYGVIGETNLDQLRPMAEAGVVSFKLYMGSENPLVPCPPDGAILDAFSILAELGIAAPFTPRARRS
jgi:dihydroorotase-like cyclic amidohydrolase